MMGRMRQFDNGVGKAEIYMGDSVELAGTEWPTPVTIICDGAYGVHGFRGDPGNPRSLPGWYSPHIAQWSQQSASYTTLWFWGTEISWATIHPVLKNHGWVYVACNIWDKGISHIAGNSNSKTLRRFPQVTEVCVQYVRQPVIIVSEKETSLKQWLRDEWNRSGLAFREANIACGVRNAATRKYLTLDDAWYMPPPAAFDLIVEYVNAHGKEDGRPYFTVDGKTAVNWAELVKMKGQEICRAKFNGTVGVTNVWNHQPVRGSERVKKGGKTYHANQKPLRLMEQIITASTDLGDVVWEPFGGLCTAAAAALNLGRHCYSAEIDRDCFETACQRIQSQVEILRLPI